MREAPKGPEPQIPELPGTRESPPKDRKKPSQDARNKFEFQFDVHCCVRSPCSRGKSLQNIVIDLHMEPLGHTKTSILLRTSLKNYK